MSLVAALRVQKSSLKWLAAILVMAGGGLACLAALGFYSFGSVGDALAYMKGQRIFARAEALVSTPTGQEREFDLIVANRGGERCGSWERSHPARAWRRRACQWACRPTADAPSG